MTITVTTTADQLRAIPLDEIIAAMRDLTRRFQPTPDDTKAGTIPVNGYDEADDVYEAVSRCFTEVQRRHNTAMRESHKPGAAEVDPLLELAFYRAEKIVEAAYAGQAAHVPVADEEVLSEDGKTREPIPASELTPHTTQSWTPDEKTAAGAQE